MDVCVRKEFKTSFRIALKNISFAKRISWMAIYKVQCYWIYAVDKEDSDGVIFFSIIFPLEEWYIVRNMVIVIN